MIREELESFFEKARDLKGEMRASREDIAKAMRDDSFDEEVMGEAFGRQDDQLRGVREALVGSLARIHDVLDDEQRKRLARLLESGPSFGPYRA